MNSILFFISLRSFSYQVFEYYSTFVLPLLSIKLLLAKHVFIQLPLEAAGL